VRISGELAALEATGASRNALARALAGLPVYAGTAALIREGLKRLTRRRQAITGDPP
jgi:hypothetical protein